MTSGAKSTLATQPTLAVSGASGFIGQALVPRLAAAGWRVRRLQRQGDEWPETALAGCSAVVHLAGRAHVIAERAADPLAAYMQANCVATLRLAEAAARAGVRRFVFLSTLKVNGESTPPGRPFTAFDPPAPQDAYAVSKAAAEAALQQLAASSALQVCIIRPPLVYGPGVKGNFHRLLRLIELGLPLPLASIDNRRSLVGIANLCSLIERALTHAGAANATLLVSDGNDLSTPQLFRLAGAALHRPVRLFPLPPALLRGAAALAGRSAIADRLCSSLQADIAATCSRLDWQPPLGVTAGMASLATRGSA